MRARTIFLGFLVIGLASCSIKPDAVTVATNNRDAALDALLGQRVTLRGTLQTAGKFGPYLEVRQTVVYVEPAQNGAIYSYGKIYDQLNGHAVEMTGTLHFEHSAPRRSGPSAQVLAYAVPVNHYWLEAEKVQIHELAGGSAGRD